MDPPAIQSGFGSAVAEVRRFLAEVQFDQPLFLWLTLLPLVLAILGAFARRRLKKRIAAFGRPASVMNLFTEPVRSHWLARLLLSSAWTAFAIALAGPSWGKTEDDGIAVGRDIVVVLDISRSMLAEDLEAPGTRFQAAVNAVKDLLETLRTRGGNRVGIAIFAARPLVFVPLTTDFQHLELKLLDLDAIQPPPGTRPLDDSVKSGTRIGAALQLAVESHDPRFMGSQEIILLTDGDDPEPDREWTKGVTVARKAGIPVHVVGFGDPTQASTVTVKSRPDELIYTRFEEAMAKEIAVEGRGEYLPARRSPAALGEFFRSKIEPLPVRMLDDDRSTRRKDRCAGFWLASAAFLLLAWWKRPGQIG